MRVLLDEQIDWRLARAFTAGHEVRSVRGMGWTGKRNGDLLRAAELEFDVFVTLDQNMEHQQSLARFRLAVLLLQVPSNRLEDTAPLVPAIERVLAAGVGPGRLYVVAA